ncbi:MAG: F0F1 ATP synthase subunit alpha [Candidatus Zambryskibacteria bacterium CG10_big_fil_rev_8_21_14_0_10_42_12]|uniref:ATP synthase subunit alpha n=1 Tax=Candidatus Zambryskibacteria bacterium CG10_big_fil_rev_8_21_14_0_10_42_12 TaxID=1975115 RepID=A0A2H0QWJ0_9BACT|nr:MAG: F0F1 ATP synthase subunit alpha [Candidatus Zambryskibacteria bacterium CG10_big_fil_rev_8_21_14_0_10_42_12]
MSSKQFIEQLEKKIDSFSRKETDAEIGRVVDAGDGIAHVSGLSGVESMEMLEFSGGVSGIAFNLEADSVGAVILGEFAHITEGTTVTRTKKILSVPVGKALVGRIVNPLCEPIDGKGLIDTAEHGRIEKKAPGVMSREPVNQPLQTGIKAIDVLVPVGRGQRELIIGDRQTGKTTVAIDTILNQKGRGVKCIYVAIGQKKSNVARIAKRLEDAGAMEYTTIVASGASESAALTYLAPYTGATIAEYFMDKGEDTLVVYDDLSKHAVAYREISLLLRRPPGREAYPGDVFYIHSRLLERACRRNVEHGGGSMTALPIIETQAGDVSAYIPTNVISITDGQIFLESNLFFKGIRPAINVGLSVSRVGGSAQLKSMKKAAGRVKLDLAQFRELESFSQFAGDLDKETKARLDRGARLVEALKQGQNAPIDTPLQIIWMYAVSNGLFDDADIVDMTAIEKSLYTYLESNQKELLKELLNTWSEEVEGKIKEAVAKFKIQM